MPKRNMWSMAAVVVAGLIAAASSAEDPLTALQARADMDILQQSLTTLHPGLNRYLKPGETGAMFEVLRSRYADAPDTRARFLVISETLARIRCGNTYCNFWNQPDAVKSALFEGKDRVPFAFRFIGGRMFVVRDATVAGGLKPGTEVREINGVPVETIVARLMLYAKADGANDAKRLKGLEVTGRGDYEAFDIYYANAFAPVPENYRLSVITPETSKVQEIAAPAMTREERKKGIDARYPEKGNKAPWSFEVLEGGVGYLRLGTFAAQEIKFDPREFLRAAFKQLKAQQIANLVVDIRGNQGGDDAVVDGVLRYLLSAPLMLTPPRELLRYDAVSELLAPHLSGQDESFKDQRKKVVAAERGFYTWKNTKPGAVEYKPGGDAFGGKIYLLIDAANVAEAMRLAQILSADPRVTLVGQATGGNLKGTNGNPIAWLRLPNSKIEVDIPLVGEFPADNQPDAGLDPDVVVTPTLDGILNGVDEELRAALELIGKS